MQNKNIALGSMKAKARLKHETILKSKMLELEIMEQNRFKQKMNLLSKSLTSSELKFVSEVIITHLNFLRNFLSEEEYKTFKKNLSGFIPIEYGVEGTITSSSEKITSKLIKYRDEKRKVAHSRLQNELKEIEESGERDGERLWSQNMSDIMRKWEVNGDYYSIYKRSIERGLITEEELVKQYVRDQVAQTHKST